MNKCNLLDSCTFINDFIRDMPKAADTMKSLYCHWHYEKCARFIISDALGDAKIPFDLFPGDKMRARMIIDQES